MSQLEPLVGNMKLLTTSVCFVGVSVTLAVWSGKDHAVDVDLGVAPSEMGFWGRWIWNLPTALIIALGVFMLLFLTQFVLKKISAS